MDRISNSKEFKIKKNRSPYFLENINSIRAFGMIIIIIAHSSNLTFNLNIDFDFYRSMAYIGVDIFTFLSGMLLTINIQNTKNHSWNKWFKKRIIRIYPLLILSTVFVLIYRFVLFDEIYNLNEILIHISGFQGLPTNPLDIILNIYYAIWFITFILSCYIVFPLLYYLLKKNFKLTLGLGIFVYIIFFIFNTNFYSSIEFLFSKILHKEILINYFRTYFPHFFTFFFGMIIGYKFELDDGFPLIFNNNRLKQLSLFIFLFLCILSILLYTYFSIDFLSYISFFTILIFPMITLSSTIFFTNYLANKPKFNNFFKLIGNHAYEIFLVHLIPITTFSLLKLDLELYFLFLVIVIILSLVISHPFYFIGTWIRFKKPIHDLIIIISLSLIVYALVVYLLKLDLKFNNLHSLILFLSILVFLSIVKIIIREIKIRKSNEITESF